MGVGSRESSEIPTVPHPDARDEERHLGGRPAGGGDDSHYH
jgi:hypothetical protein